MPVIELEREKFYSIFYDSDERWIYVNWTGYQTSLSVQQGCNRMLELMVAHRTHSVLNDNTNVLGIWSGAAEWVATDWFPRMQQAGLQRFAWIYSPSRLSQVSTDATLSYMDSESSGVKVFSDVNEAKAWLREKG